MTDSGWMVMAGSFGILFAVRYPLVHSVHSRLNALLNQQRSGQPVDEAEKRALTRLLIG